MMAAYCRIMPHAPGQIGFLWTVSENGSGGSVSAAGCVATVWGAAAEEGLL